MLAQPYSAVLGNPRSVRIAATVMSAMPAGPTRRFLVVPPAASRTAGCLRRARRSAGASVPSLSSCQFNQLGSCVLIGRTPFQGVGSAWVRLWKTGRLSTRQVPTSATCRHGVRPRMSCRRDRAHISGAGVLDSQTRRKVLLFATSTGSIELPEGTVGSSQ